jgi:hypothetical protein
MTAARLATLRSSLDRAALRLKLAVASGNWKAAVTHAEEAAGLEDELRAARADEAKPERPTA